MTESMGTNYSIGKKLEGRHWACEAIYYERKCWNCGSKMVKYKPTLFLEFMRFISSVVLIGRTWVDWKKQECIFVEVLNGL